MTEHEQEQERRLPEGHPLADLFRRAREGDAEAQQELREVLAVMVAWDREEAARQAPMAAAIRLDAQVSLAVQRPVPLAPLIPGA